MFLSISTNATLVYGLNTSGKCQTKQVGNPSSNTTNINITQYIFKIDIYVVYILHSREFIMRIWAMTSGFEHRKTCIYCKKRQRIWGSYFSSKSRNKYNLNFKIISTNTNFTYFRLTRMINSVFRFFRIRMQIYHK